MKSKALAVLSVLLVGLTTTAPAADARTWDDRAHFTFSAPVAIPGAMLPAGSYVFRLLDSDTTRQLVQVTGAHDMKVYGTFLTHLLWRQMPALTAEVTLGEAPEGEAPSISVWWQPGDAWGRSFSYRPGQASWERRPTATPDAD